MKVRIEILAGVVTKEVLLVMVWMTKTKMVVVTASAIWRREAEVATEALVEVTLRMIVGKMMEEMINQLTMCELVQVCWRQETESVLVVLCLLEALTTNPQAVELLSQRNMRVLLMV